MSRPSEVMILSASCKSSLNLKEAREGLGQIKNVEMRNLLLELLGTLVVAVDGFLNVKFLEIVQAMFGAYTVDLYLIRAIEQVRQVLVLVLHRVFEADLEFDEHVNGVLVEVGFFSDGFGLW